MLIMIKTFLDIAVVSSFSLKLKTKFDFFLSWLGCFSGNHKADVIFCKNSFFPLASFLLCIS